MGIFNHEFLIEDKDNIFKNDKLNRDSDICKLTKLFKAVDNQMVLAIDSPWGTGKTTFLKMWEAQLKKDGYSTVYFNSWKNDFVEDPYIAFIGEIKSQVDDRFIGEKFRESAKNLGMNLVKALPKASMKFIENKTGFSIEDYYSSDDFKELIGNKIDEYEKSKNSVENFKAELKNLSSKIKKETSTNSVEGKPLVIFVDELDRCRPNFAILLLERIKHFFNVENIIFILGIDREALSNSIKVIYGDGTDINGYLTRFIDLEYTLSQEYNREYINYLIDKYRFNQIASIDYSSFRHNFSGCIQAFNLSLRDTEKIISKLYLLFSTIGIRPKKINLIMFMLILYKVNKEAYINIKLRNTTVVKLLEVLPEGINKWFYDSYEEGYIVEANLIYILSDKDRIEHKKRLVEENKSNEANEKGIRYYESLYKEGNFYIDDILKYITDFIEIM
ncbi:KAP family P-loop NTPase fold protein [Paeniclostridium hominis]|uniref:KAP family P-loop NTPase fold protein n=1 Tax=Paeniclostridium hominis TaxID=2764329 RepID=UPI0022E8AB26|nr:P-loop NTPase fold protein [Paeniclostridium hominis]